jgi:lactate dehydrogenase-like 2-hydroxyacid dehydrogenase
MKSSIKHHLFLARPMLADVEAAATRDFDVLLARHILSPSEIIERAHTHRAEGLVLSGSLKLNAELIAALPRSMRVLSTTSVGFDHIDVVAAKAHGMVVTNSPVVTECTADMTMLQILAACRRAREFQALMSEGWGRPLALDELLGMRVTGKALGIVGMGRIGQAVAMRARGFGMKIHYHGPRRLSPALEMDAIFHPTLEAMLPRVHITSLHLPAAPSGGALMGASQFALMPKGAIFINTARGSLVDENALLDALTSGHIAAAGLDVFASEPHFNKRLLEFPRVFLTPHVGSATTETRRDLGLRAVENALSVLRGTGAINPV